MPTSLAKVRSYLGTLFAQKPQAEFEELLLPTEDEISPRLSGAPEISEDRVRQRWSLLERNLSGRTANADELRSELLDPRTASRMSIYARNIENFIGTTELPVGLAGPLRIRGLFAQGDYYIPLATSEAALVASYARGAQAISASGGCSAMCCTCRRRCISMATSRASTRRSWAGRMRGS